MKRYIVLQFKRLLRVLPFVALAAAVLFGALGAIYAGLMGSERQSQESNPFRVALVGTQEDTILQMGISALGGMDASRFALQVVQMEEADARTALEQGSIAAYVVFPEGFMDNAMQGNILPLRFVSPAGASNIGSILRIELTRVISDILDAAQKGTYGSVSAMRELAGVKNPWPIAQQLALSYTQLILLRGDVYEARSLGLSDGLGLEGHLLCGLCVLLAMLCTLPFAPTMIHKDASLNKLLCAKGFRAIKQVLCELIVYYILLYALLAVLLTGVLRYVGPQLSLDVTGVRLYTWLPVMFAVASLSYLLYELSTDVISGVLLQFFLFVFLCFICGCFYPAYFFPDVVQKLGSILPAGLARSHLAGAITGSGSAATTLGLMAWGVGLTALSAFLRSYKLKRVEVTG